MMESLITEYDKTGYIRERTGAILPNVAPSNVYPTQRWRHDPDRRQPGHGVRQADGSHGPAGTGEGRALRDPHGPRRTPEGTRRPHRRLDPHHRCRSARAVDGEVRHSVRQDLPRRRRCWKTPTSARAKPSSRPCTRSLANCACRTWHPSCPATPGGIHSPAPELGQHSDEIYRSLLGFDSARIDGPARAGDHLSPDTQPARPDCLRDRPDAVPRRNGSRLQPLSALPRRRPGPGLRGPGNAVGYARTWREHRRCSWLRKQRRTSSSGSSSCRPNPATAPSRGTAGTRRN